MEKEILISVIVPVYNAEKYLEECLDSILGQTYRNLEIILINDGSKDTSGEICRRYREKDSRILLIEQENAGEAVARNKGLEAASGEFLVFVDADDLISPTICNTASKSFQNHDVIVFGFERFREPKDIIRNRFSVETEKDIIQEYCGKDFLQAVIDPAGIVPENTNLHSMWSKFYRRSYLKRYGIECPLEVIIGTDMLFNIQVYLRGPRIGYLPIVGYFYRTNPTSVVHRYIHHFHNSDTKFHKELEMLLRRNGLGEIFWNAMQYQKMNGMLITFSNDIFHPDNPKSNNQKKMDFLELVSRKEYQTLIPIQAKYFSFKKRLLLSLARNKRYYLLKIIYVLKKQMGIL